MELDDPYVQAFVAALDREKGLGYAQSMFDDDPVLFEVLCNEWLAEREHDVTMGNKRMPEPEDQDEESDARDHDPAVQITHAWLRKHVPECQETAIADLAAEADRDYLKLFENSGLPHRTLEEVCQQAETLTVMAQTGDLSLDDRGKGLLGPDTVVALSHDADGEGIPSGPGYYSSFRRAVESELIVYLAAELGGGGPPTKRDLERYKRICRRLYATVLLHNRTGDTSQACALVRRALDEFAGSQGDVFHTLEDSLRCDGYPLVDPEEFRRRFEIPVQKMNANDPEQWQWIIDHLAPPYA